MVSRSLKIRNGGKRRRSIRGGMMSKKKVESKFLENVGKYKEIKETYFDSENIAKHLIEPFDKDGNGHLDLNELTANIESYGNKEAIEKLIKVIGYFIPLLPKIDRNKDKKISNEEIISYATERNVDIELATELADVLILFLDNDGDGGIDGDEISRWKKAQKKISEVWDIRKRTKALEQFDKATKDMNFQLDWWQKRIINLKEDICKLRYLNFVNMEPPRKKFKVVVKTPDSENWEVIGYVASIDDNVQEAIRIMYKIIINAYLRGKTGKVSIGYYKSEEMEKLKSVNTYPISGREEDFNNDNEDAGFVKLDKSETVEGEKKESKEMERKKKEIGEISLKQNEKDRLKEHINKLRKEMETNKKEIGEISLEQNQKDRLNEHINKLREELKTGEADFTKLDNMSVEDFNISEYNTYMYKGWFKTVKRLEGAKLPFLQDKWDNNFFAQSWEKEWMDNLIENCNEISLFNMITGNTDSGNKIPPFLITALVVFCRKGARQSFEALGDSFHEGAKRVGAPTLRDIGNAGRVELSFYALGVLSEFVCLVIGVLAKIANPSSFEEKVGCNGETMEMMGSIGSIVDAMYPIINNNAKKFFYSILNTIGCVGMVAVNILVFIATKVRKFADQFEGEQMTKFINFCFRQYKNVTNILVNIPGIKTAIDTMKNIRVVETGRTLKQMYYSTVTTYNYYRPTISKEQLELANKEIENIKNIRGVEFDELKDVLDPNFAIRKIKLSLKEKYQNVDDFWKDIEKGLMREEGSMKFIQKKHFLSYFSGMRKEVLDTIWRNFCYATGTGYPWGSILKKDFTRKVNTWLDDNMNGGSNKYTGRSFFIFAETMVVEELQSYSKNFINFFSGAALEEIILIKLINHLLQNPTNVYSDEDYDFLYKKSLEYAKQKTPNVFSGLREELAKTNATLAQSKELLAIGSLKGGSRKKRKKKSNRRRKVKKRKSQKKRKTQKKRKKRQK